MTTFIKPPDDMSRSSIGKYMVGIPCVDEQRYAEVKMPRLLDPSQCELAGDAINTAATEKLRQKGLILLRECLVYNRYGGLAGLQIGSPELVAFEERINARLAEPGAETPAGCSQSVPAGLAAAVSALAGSCMGLERPHGLPYAAEMLLTVRVDQDNMNPGISSMLTDITTEGLRSLPGGRYSYSLRSLLQRLQDRVLQLTTFVYHVQLWDTFTWVQGNVQRALASSLKPWKRHSLVTGNEVLSC